MLCCCLFGRSGSARVAGRGLSGHRERGPEVGKVGGSGGGRGEPGQGRALEAGRELREGG